MVNRTIIAYGSNLGGRINHINKAIALLSNFGEVKQMSSNYSSNAEGYQSDNTYINGCLSLETTLDSEQLLVQLKEIESSLGRETIRGVYTDRPIDLDIIFFNSLQTKTALLTIPHPRYSERSFVVVPLIELENHLTDWQKSHLISSILKELKAPSIEEVMPNQLKPLYFIEVYLSKAYEGQSRTY